MSREAHVRFCERLMGKFHWPTHHIGKLPVFRGEGDTAYADVMVFLVPNGSEPNNQVSQIVNVHFPKALCEALNTFGQGDYIQAGFDRIDLVKGIDEQSEPMLYVTVKANSIKLLRKAVKEHKA